MTDEVASEEFQEVAARFADLWAAITCEGREPRRPDIRPMLINQVRAALDRGTAALDPCPTTIIANSFIVEGQVHAAATTSVLRLRHRDLFTLHALKTLASDSSYDPAAQQRLLREAEIGMELRHPHCLATQMVLRLDDGRPAMLMEWAGSTLAGRLNGTALSVGDVGRIMSSVFSGLDAIHRAGLIHCDISPANLLFAGENATVLRIADFGIALRLGERHADLDLALAAQPQFASPEQRAGAVLDGRSDLFACGRLMAVLLDHCDGDDSGRLRGLSETLCREKLEDRPDNARQAGLTLDTLLVEMD